MISAHHSGRTRTVAAARPSSQRNRFADDATARVKRDHGVHHAANAKPEPRRARPQRQPKKYGQRNQKNRRGGKANHNNKQKQPGDNKENQRNGANARRRHRQHRGGGGQKRALAAAAAAGQPPPQLLLGRLRRHALPAGAGDLPEPDLRPTQRTGAAAVAGRLPRAAPGAGRGAGPLVMLHGRRHAGQGRRHAAAQAVLKGLPDDLRADAELGREAAAEPRGRLRVASTACS